MNIPKSTSGNSFNFVPGLVYSSNKVRLFYFYLLFCSAYFRAFCFIGHGSVHMLWYYTASLSLRYPAPQHNYVSCPDFPLHSSSRPQAVANTLPSSFSPPFYSRMHGSSSMRLVAVSDPPGQSLLQTAGLRAELPKKLSLSFCHLVLHRVSRPRRPPHFARVGRPRC